MLTTPGHHCARVLQETQTWGKFGCHAGILAGKGIQSHSINILCPTWIEKWKRCLNRRLYNNFCPNSYIVKHKMKCRKSSQIPLYSTSQPGWPQCPNNWKSQKLLIYIENNEENMISEASVNTHYCIVKEEGKTHLKRNKLSVFEIFILSSLFGLVILS